MGSGDPTPRHARLLVTARNSATGEETVEVTHEALIRNWALLRGWVDQDREFLRSKARIEAAAALWEGEKRDVSRLLPASDSIGIFTFANTRNTTIHMRNDGAY
jgi:hypothetical protein